jgi:hypothetical protein
MRRKSKLQIPSSKQLINEENSKRLEFIILNLFGIWFLEFGI